jgi:hypothetical protein
MRARRTERAFERGGEHDTLAVVAHHHRLALRQFAPDAFEHALERRAGQIRAALAIRAHHLLRVSDDAGLDRGRAAAVPDHAAHVDAALAERAEQPDAGFVVPDHADQDRRGTESGQIGRNVARAAQGVTLALDFDHGHRRFVRDPLDASPDVAIEHEIAQHEHAAPREGGDAGAQRFERGGCGHGARR